MKKNKKNGTNLHTAANSCRIKLLTMLLLNVANVCCHLYIRMYLGCAVNQPFQFLIKLFTVLLMIFHRRHTIYLYIHCNYTHTYIGIYIQTHTHIHIYINVCEELVFLKFVIVNWSLFLFFCLQDSSQKI